MCTAFKIIHVNIHKSRTVGAFEFDSELAASPLTKRSGLVTSLPLIDWLPLGAEQNKKETGGLKAGQQSAMNCPERQSLDFSNHFSLSSVKCQAEKGASSWLERRF